MKAKTANELWQVIIPHRETLYKQVYDSADAGILLLEGIEQVLEENGIPWDMDMLQRRKELINSVYAIVEPLKEFV